MNNVIMCKITLTDEYQSLTDKDLEVASIDISTPPTNAGLVIFQGDDGSEVPWIPGEWHKLLRVNLASILVKGTPGDVVTIVGGTW